MPTTKLYLPYGTFGDASDRKQAWYSPYAQITLHWFCVDRPEPIAPYESLILGYRGLTPEARLRAEQTVDEFFSETEYHQLRDFLRDQHKQDLRTTVLAAPVSAIRPDAATKTGTLRPYRQCAVAGTPREKIVVSDSEDEDTEESDGPGPALEEGGFCKLTEQEGYSLPFAVWGYYSAAARPGPLRSLPPVHPFSPPLRTTPSRPGR